MLEIDGVPLEDMSNDTLIREGVAMLFVFQEIQNEARSRLAKQDAATYRKNTKPVLIRPLPANR